MLATDAVAVTLVAMKRPIAKAEMVENCMLAMVKLEL